jgi:hypothetical protein
MRDMCSFASHCPHLGLFFLDRHVVCNIVEEHSKKLTGHLALSLELHSVDVFEARLVDEDLVHGRHKCEERVGAEVRILACDFFAVAIAGDGDGAVSRHGRIGFLSGEDAAEVLRRNVNNRAQKSCQPASLTKLLKLKDSATESSKSDVIC